MATAVMNGSGHQEEMTAERAQMILADAIGQSSLTFQPTLAERERALAFLVDAYGAL